MAEAELEARGPSRRTALWLMGAAGLVALGADGARHSSSAAVRTPPNPGTPGAAPVPTPTPTPKPVPKPRPSPWTTEKLTATKTPIRNLTELVPPPPPRTIALTIDDGPHPLWTPRVLDILDEHDVKATFFIIGQQVDEFPRIARRIADHGHQVCNHTMTHPILSGVSARVVKKEIVQAHHKIADVTGVVPTFFRAPGGGWSKRVYETIAEHGMLPIDWAVDPRDWERPGVGAIRRTLVGSQAGNILLCHDGGGERSQTLAALDQAIPRLKRKGLVFTAL
ncbi:polysaccharide deacetylase family protein [Actinomadura kijaniata]|uniref:polysaccharide deacetylase family protein n=1 Tax=Actinomadura kijaniata TaxID=46161 RepID=UPI001FDFEF07|nr:polysaccharide deacetylase family protein [Actinomadura kijaniata]